MVHTVAATENISQKLLNRAEGLVEWFSHSHVSFLLWAGFGLSVALGVIVLTNPFCYLSGHDLNSCTIGVKQFVTFYDGKGAALQFAGTGVLFSLIVLILGPARMYETERESHTPTKIALAAVFTVLGYGVVLAGLYTDFAHANDEIALIFALPFVLFIPLYAILAGLIMGFYLLAQGVVGTQRLYRWLLNRLTK